MAKRIPIDLLLFDFDGTLTDSIPPAVEAIQAMLKELGLPDKTAAEINQHVGFGEIPLVAGAIGSQEPALLNKAMAVYFKYYVDEGIKKVTIYPHVKECLEYFKDKPKIILSNKRGEFIKLILDDHGLTLLFAEIYGGDDVECPKPDPCMILKLLGKHNIAPDRALLIGDMTVDVETGRNAKIKTCAVTYGFDSKEKLIKAGPDFLINDLLALKDMIV